MNLKTIVLLGLSMCLSFTTILVFMISVKGPSARTTGHRAASVGQAFPSDTADSTKLALLQGRLLERLKQRATNQTSQGQLESRELEPLAQPLPTGTGSSSNRSAPATGRSDQDRQLDRVAVQQITLLKRDLTRRVAVLEDNRNDLVNRLADELTEMPAATAATQIKALDDESAARVLASVNDATRQPILDHLSKQRANRLSHTLGGYIAN